MTEAVAQRCSAKKVFLEISQNSKKTPVPEFLLFFGGVKWASWPEMG